MIALLTTLSLLVTNLLLTTVSAAPAGENVDRNQTASNIAYNEMLNAFSETRLGRSLMRLEDLNNADVFPDYYAGAYLNGSGNLVVLLTQDTDQTRASIRSAAKKSDVLFQSAPYASVSYTHLSGPRAAARA